MQFPQGRQSFPSSLGSTRLQDFKYTRMLRCMLTRTCPKLTTSTSPQTVAMRQQVRTVRSFQLNELFQDKGHRSRENIPTTRPFKESKPSNRPTTNKTLPSTPSNHQDSPNPGLLIIQFKTLSSAHSAQTFGQL